MTGFEQNSAASLAEPSCGCLSTIASEYASAIFAVSASVSPLRAEVTFGSAKPMYRPPSLHIALWKESLVRVLGS